VPQSRFTQKRILSIRISPTPKDLSHPSATCGREQRVFRQGAGLAPIYPLITASDGLQLTACLARVDAVAPTGGMAVVTAAWGMPVAVMVQVRVRT
jgi:hypothetical protein